MSSKKRNHKEHPDPQSTLRKARPRRRAEDPTSRREGRRKAAALRRRHWPTHASVADSRAAQALVDAPGVVYGDRVLDASSWRHDPELGVLVTVNDASGAMFAWGGWEVRLDELAVSATLPDWLVEHEDGLDLVDGGFSDELSPEELAEGGTCS